MVRPKPAAAALVAAALLTGAVAGHLPAALNPQYDAVLAVAALGPVTTLDPTEVTTPAEKDLVMALFEGLVRGETHEPAAAVRWSRSEDGLRWTFHLRSGMTFTDGTPVNADSFVSSWERLRSASGGAERLEGLTARAETESTLIVELTSPDEHLLDRLAGPSFVAVKPAGQGSLVGSGAFRLAGAAGGTFTLRARLDHHAGRPFPARVIVRAGTTPPAPRTLDSLHVVDFPDLPSPSAGGGDPWGELVLDGRHPRLNPAIRGLHADRAAGAVRFEEAWLLPAGGP